MKRILLLCYITCLNCDAASPEPASTDTWDIVRMHQNENNTVRPTETQNNGKQDDSFPYKIAARSLCSVPDFVKA